MEKKSYAYITKAGILHITPSIEGAERSSATGKFVETDIENRGGYPLWEGDEVLMYSPTKMDKHVDGKPIPELSDFYRMVAAEIGYEIPVEE